MRYLGVDLGGKRTGLALGDQESGIASPLRVLEIGATADGGKALLAAICRVVEEHRPGAIVVGLPINMDDTEGPAAKQARAFGERLSEQSGLPVHLFDERLTSSDADWAMAGSGLTHGQKKSRRDALAAAAILRDFMAFQSRAEDNAATESTDNDET